MQAQSSPQEIAKSAFPSPGFDTQIKSLSFAAFPITTLFIYRGAANKDGVIVIVQQWMTSKVITVQERESLAECMFILRENKIRKLPVMRGDRLVGIITDKDIKEYTPSKATSLDEYEIHYLLTKVSARDVMTRDPMTISPETTVEEAALIMHENRLDVLPVMRMSKLVGIITESDIFKVLVYMSGARFGGVQIGVDLDDTADSLYPLLEIIRKHGAKIISMFSIYDQMPDGRRCCVIRLIGKELEPLIQNIKEQFPIAFETKL
ncbi:MAG: CBS domain-containing protein [Deltaproteobacteria bacterium]|nr:CBS domain-containing protein [Deltaproteobacteria bacterium]MBW2305726.1 CBS domain-containing protein [Deltaproteobacteria bacterium]